MTNKLFSIWIAAVPMMTAGPISAQEFSGAVVKYRQTIRYDFYEVFDQFRSPEVDDWIASLPSQSLADKVLYVTPERALFTDDPEERSPAPENLGRALEKAEYLQGPRSELLEVYTDFNKNETTEWEKFMTRFFLISGPVRKAAWKLTNERIKIQDYVCISAEMKQGEDVIKAWFTPQIPVPAGPASFGGLPGLILAVERNGETAYFAISIEWTPPAEAALKPPDKGKKVTQEEFERLAAEKVEEWKKSQRKEYRSKDYRK